MLNSFQLSHRLFSTRGFTLIELLVVVLIIGILAAIAVPQYQKSVDKAKASQLFTIVQNLKTQQEIFFLTNGYYATSCEELGGDFPAEAESAADSTQPGLWKIGQETYFYCCKEKKQCAQQNGTRVSAKIQNNNWTISIESFFDHFSGSKDEGNQGRSFCYYGTDNPRGEVACKSLGGKEVKSAGTSYWL